MTVESEGQGFRLLSRKERIIPRRASGKGKVMSDIVEVMAESLYTVWKHPTERGSWSSHLEFSKVMWRQRARAALAALEGAGYAVVPVEPTPAMNNAYGSDIEENYRCWKAMLSAYKHPAADTAGTTRREGQEDRNPDDR